MQPIHIVIPGKPEVWSRPRVSTRSGRVVMFDPKAANRKKLGLTLKEYFPTPLEGPIKVQLELYFSIKDKKKWGKYKTSKVDLDNVVKFWADCLNQVAYKDDAQICSLVASKRWSETDVTHIWISKLDEY